MSLSGKVHPLIGRYGVSIGLQFGGQVLSLVGVFLIARYFGPAMQGEFARLKSTADFVFAVLLLGTPQSFIYAINFRIFSRRALFRLTARYAALLCLVVPLLFLLLDNFNFYHIAMASALAGALAISAYVIGIIFLTMCRSIILTMDDGLPFSFVTIMPSLAMFAMVAGAILLAGTLNLGVVFAGVGLICAIAAYALWRHLSPTVQEAETSGHKRLLFTHSANSFLQAMLFSAQPFITVTLLSRAGADSALIGNFHVAMILWAAYNTLFAMVSPQLMNHWTQGDGADPWAHLRHILRIALPLALLGCGIGVFIIDDIVALIFGPAYQAAQIGAQISLIGLPILLVSQLMTPLLLALGRVHLLSWGSVTRFSTAIIAFFLLGHIDLPLIARAAGSWLLAEVMATAVLLLLSWRGRTERA